MTIHRGGIFAFRYTFSDGTSFGVMAQELFGKTEIVDVIKFLTALHGEPVVTDYHDEQHIPHHGGDSATYHTNTSR